MSEDNILTAHGWIRGRLIHEHGKVPVDRRRALRSGRQ
jgi:hypothetical protein